jgi:hypothetical protein
VILDLKVFIVRNEEKERERVNIRVIGKVLRVGVRTMASNL